MLVDSDAISNRVLSGLLTEIGMPMTPEESVETFMGRSWKTVIAYADERGGLPEGFRRRYLDGMFAAFEQELRPVPGITAVMAGWPSSHFSANCAQLVASISRAISGLRIE